VRKRRKKVFWRQKKKSESARKPWREKQKKGAEKKRRIKFEKQTRSAGKCTPNTDKGR